MSKSDAFEAAILDLIFKGTAIAGLADNAASAPVANLYVALHTADPGEAGDQTSSEVAYTGYARVAVARSGAGWTRTGSSVSPAANVDFPECTAGTGTATYFSIGVAASGASMILYSGALTPSIAYAAGTIPRLKTASTITED